MISKVTSRPVDNSSYQQFDSLMPGLHQRNSRCFTVAFLIAALESGRCESILLFLSSSVHVFLVWVDRAVKLRDISLLPVSAQKNSTHEFLEWIEL